MPKPIISIVMTAYNAQDTIKEAIISILNQTFSNFELIIIDDGSTDQSKKIIQQFKDRRVKLFSFKKNKGHSYATNYGFQIAQGKYIARMDADDISLPKRLDKQISFLEKNKKIGVVGAWVELIGQGVTGKIWQYPGNPQYIQSCFMFFCPIAQPISMFRRELISKHKILHQEKYKRYADYYFWYECNQLMPCANLPEVLLKYRVDKTKINKYTSKSCIKIPNLIRQKILDDLNIKYQKDELRIHCQIANEKFTNYKQLIAMRKWLQCLLKENKNKNFFDQHIFKIVIADRWFNLQNSVLSLDIKCFLVFLLTNIYWFLPIKKNCNFIHMLIFKLSMNLRKK